MLSFTEYFTTLLWSHVVTIHVVLVRFCPDCKNDTSDVITAGEKLKLSKKKSKMISNINKDCTRDWGKVCIIHNSITCTVQKGC